MREVHTEMEFDTYKYVQDFKKAGIEEGQAAAIIQVIKASRTSDFANIATKDQLSITKQELKQEIAEVRHEISEVRSELKQEIAELRGELKQDIAKIETMIAKQDANQKAWFLGLFITILATAISIFLKIKI